MHGATIKIRNLHVSDSFSVHHQESSTVHTAIGMSYSLCRLLTSGVRIPSCQNLELILQRLILAEICSHIIIG